MKRSLNVEWWRRTPCLGLLVLLLSCCVALAATPSGVRLATGVRGAQNFMDAAIAPDGKFAVIAGNGHMKVVDTASGIVLQEVAVGASWVMSTAIDVSGRYVISAGRDSVRVWRLPELTLERQLATGDFTTVRVAQDGSLVVATTFQGEIYVWTPRQDWTLRHRLKAAGPLGGLAISSDGKLIATGQAYNDNRGRLTEGAELSVWNAVDGRLIWKTQAHLNDIRSLSFANHDRNVISAAYADIPGGTRTVSLWRVDDGQHLSDFGRYSSVLTGLSPARGKTMFALRSNADQSTSLMSLDWDSLRITEVCTRIDTMHFLLQGKDGLAFGVPRWGARYVIWPNFPDCAKPKSVGYLDSSNTPAFHYFEGDGLLVMGYPDSVVGFDIRKGQTRFAIPLKQRNWPVITRMPAADRFMVLNENVLTVRSKTSGAALSTFDLADAISQPNIYFDNVFPLTDHLVALAIRDSRHPMRQSTGADTGSLVLYDLKTRKVIDTLSLHSDHISAGSYFAGKDTLITSSWDGTVKGLHLESGKITTYRRGAGQVTAIAGSPGGDAFVATWAGQTGPAVGAWNIDSASATWVDLPSEGFYSARYSADGKTVLLAGRNAVAVAADTGKLLRQYESVEPGQYFSSAAYLNAGAGVVAMSRTGEVFFWNAHSSDGSPPAKLLLGQDRWIISHESRFDLSSFDEFGPVGWVARDDPFHALRPELFMRDYFTPRLLPRLLAGEKFRELPPLETLNRVQPAVRIMAAKPTPRQDGNIDAIESVDVTVEVAGGRREFGIGASKRTMASDAFDLRLFRDGQLVGQFPPEPEAVEANSTGDERERWRAARLVVRQADGTRRVTFKGIRLPRVDGKERVEFSAYAFNVDRVKSETARLGYLLPEKHAPRKPVAYLVTLGVNEFEDPSWNLQYAANDALQSGAELSRRLGALRARDGEPLYRDVVWVPLIAGSAPGAPITETSSSASKAQVEAVLKTLAGQTVDPQQLRGITGATKLQRVKPEDLVMLVISTHGVVDEAGTFYLLPSDIGRKFSPDSVTRTFPRPMLARAMSTDELAKWMRGLDAVDQVMIIDACHSAASVQSNDFKPGPMGSRGLGQLAYDKGMRILAATQVDQDAVEKDQTKMGLLIYSLIEDGLRAGKADTSIPPDGRIMLSEWLNYASARVPEVFESVEEGTLVGSRGRVEYATSSALNAERKMALQQPTLFDFARHDTLIEQK